MPEQLVFDLPVRTALGRGDFFVSPANAAALETLENWRGWPGGKCVLTGPPGSGKTHLGHVWATETGGQVIAADALANADIPTLAARPHLVVEDADRMTGRAAEEALLHLHNLIAEAGGALLLTAMRPPAAWPLKLADLASRMQAAQIARLAPPDDRLLASVLLKLFHDRQLVIAPDLVVYLVSRMERSFAAARGLVAALDAASLAQKRKITRRLAARVLDNPADPAS